MNEFLSRTGQVTTPAAPASGPQVAVRAVSAAASSGGAGSDRGRDNEEARLSFAARFARAKRKIADLLAELRNEEANLGDTHVAISALLPQPIISVPPPPASREQMDHAVAVAEALRQDAMLARKAQAHVHSRTAEAVVSS